VTNVSRFDAGFGAKFGAMGQLPWEKLAGKGDIWRLRYVIGAFLYSVFSGAHCQFDKRASDP
jgi:hypothetical protein